MSLKFSTSFITAFLLCCAINAQKPAQYLRAGEAAAALGRWDEAFSYYQQAYDLDSSSFDVLVHYADAAREVKYYALAERLYARSYEKDNGKLNPDALYYLAWMQKFNGRYEDAQRNFKKYVKKYKSKGSKHLVKRAEQEAKSALWALNYKMPVDTLSALRMDTLNSEASEIAPSAMEDGLYFSSTFNTEGQWRLYRNRKGEEAAVPAGQGEIANVCLHDGKAYFALSENNTTRIFTADFADGNFSNLSELKKINESGTINTMPYVGEFSGSKQLVFSSDREEGEGGMDIWISRWDGNSFAEPVNAGNRVNSPGDELTPHIYDDALYFSSDWHNGFGGFDIFKCPITETGLNKIENAGYPYNSSANDLYFFAEEEAYRIYFSSNREGSASSSENGTCCNDLYEVILPQPDMEDPEDPNRMKLMDLMATIPVILYFHNDEPNPDVWDTVTTLTYLQAYDSYMNLVPVYLKENTKGLSGEKREEAEEITNDFFELKVKKGVEDLQQFSDLLLQELQEGQSLRIYVRGFASPRAKSDYNLNLTKRRTSSLVNFLAQDKDGAFLPYINDSAANGARLEFQLIPFGEVKADKSVSDDLVDEKNSIYVRSACLERKIEIEDVALIPNTLRQARIVLPEDTFDFGRISNREPVNHTFQIINEGNAPMIIDSVVAACGCTTPKLSKYRVLPGETVELEVGFQPFKIGKDSKTVTLYLQGEEPRVITIMAETVRP